MSETNERATMIHTLREEPGSYTRTLENGSEVIYAVRPSDGGFVAGWEYVGGPGEGTAKSHSEEFSSYADAVRYLEKNFDEPLAAGGS